MITYNYEVKNSYYKYKLKKFRLKSIQGCLHKIIWLRKILKRPVKQQIWVAFIFEDDLSLKVQGNLMTSKQIQNLI